MGNKNKYQENPALGDKGAHLQAKAACGKLATDAIITTTLLPPLHPYN